MPNHPITEQSFAIIDREIGSHNFTPAEYAIVRRVIHSTADFDFKQLIRFSPGAIETAVAALRRRVPIVTDVSMVKQGAATLVRQTFANPLISAVEQVPVAPPGKTRSETGMLQCLQQWPDAIFAVGNAPTALLALCSELSAPAGPASGTAKIPPLIVGAPVGFVSVLESKAALAQLPVPQIRVEGRKGGSPVAAAILNALIVLAWEGSDKD
ncbi:cobalt-precorrin-8X methylmutase [Kamptonema formosum]|uniref:cobalt-precorrin-8X methylmutase n=1 Tax=Kamptonema formosum TaxID=331992 RepID=UPI00034513CB|nr:cobalt-precorrin-8X methylmutase [Oscillatoria sp. PCC 10802]